MLASTLRSMAQVTIQSIEQQTYDEYVRDLPNPALLTLLSLAPLQGAAIFQLISRADNIDRTLLLAIRINERPYS